MRTLEELRAAFELTGGADFLSWLSTQPEGDPFGGKSLRTPSIADQAISAGRAVVAHVRSGMHTTEPEELEKRRSICQSCDLLFGSGRCKVCGCFMQIKATWAEQKCPIGKW